MGPKSEGLGTDNSELQQILECMDMIQQQNQNLQEKVNSLSRGRNEEEDLEGETG
ncbi:aminopeptidase [Sesbania bispinosa]|nr:aminopeptidase [Sesbania bispinosa]